MQDRQTNIQKATLASNAHKVVPRDGFRSCRVVHTKFVAFDAMQSSDEATDLWPPRRQDWRGIAPWPFSQALQVQGDGPVQLACGSFLSWRG